MIADIGQLFLVARSVGKFHGHKTVPFVKAARSLIGLERPEPELFLVAFDTFDQRAANSLRLEVGTDIEMLDPACLPGEEAEQLFAAKGAVNDILSEHDAAIECSIFLRRMQGRYHTMAGPC